MKKIVCILAMLLFTTSMAFGAYVEIGDGTSTTGYVPAYGLYDYSWSQVIYLQSEIGDAIDINKISYNVSTEPDSYTMPDQKIYMKHTADAIFPDAAYDDPATAGFTLVYDGPVTWDGSGWNDIMLDTPFSYNGTDNLIVYWQNWDGDWTSGYPQFYYTSQTDRAKYKFQDNSFPEVSGTLDVYVANIRLHYLYDGPEIYLSASSYDFGMIEADTDASFDLTIYSAGTEDLVITDAVVAAPFSCDYSGGTIPAGENVVTTVWFEPTETGEYSEILTFEIGGDFAGMNTIALTGSAYPAGYVFESFEGDIFPPLAWDVQNVAGQDWAQYSYGSPPDGSKHARLYYVSGTGSQSRLITPELLPLNSGDFTKFMAQYYSAGTLTIQYSTDKETWTDLEIVPITTTYDEYTVDLSSLADGESYYLAFYGETGTGYSYMYLDAVYIPEPEPYSVMWVSDDAHDFGAHMTGTIVPEWEFTVANIGIGDLTISGITGLELPFSADYSGVLAPGDSVDISVAFDTSTPGIYVDTLIVESDADFGEGEVVLSGAVYEPLTELDESFEGDFPPLYWENDGWTQSTYGSPHSGTEFAYSMGSGDTLITPYFTVPTDPYNFVFWYCSEIATYPQTLLLNLYINTGRGWSRVDSLNFSSTEYQKGLVSLVPYAGETVQLMFDHSYSGSSAWGMCLDDVALETMSPNIVLSDTTYDFGLVEQGSEATFNVTIYNNGGMPLIVDGSTVDLPFSCDYADTIPFGGSDVATITFDTSNIGIFSGELTFHTNATQTDSVIVLSGAVFGTDYVMEGFEETTFPPFGWENPGDYWARFMTEAYEGQGYARCSWYHDVDAILISPRLVINGGDFIDFFWRNDNLYEAKGPEVITGDTLWVEISNTYLNPNPTWEVIAMLTADAPMDEYEEALVPIPDAYIGNDAKIRWRHRSELNSESRGVGLDNIIMPTPYLPINFSVDPYYASDYVGPGNPVHYTYDVTNMGVQSDRFIILVQDSSAIRYNNKDVEDFETTDGGWVATSDWDPVGDWEWTNTYDFGNYTGINIPPPTAHSGTGLWGTKVNGDYTNSGGYSYLSQTFDFSDVTDAYLNFWYWSDIFGNFDWCDIVVNGDILLTIDTYNPTNWILADLDLSAYDGLSNVQVVFAFYATTVVEHAGMYIDDLDIPGGGSGPGPGPTGWPATVNVPYLNLAPGEIGSFVLTISIPEDANEEDVQLTPVLVYSREDYAVEHQVLALATCHPKDPYEPNNVIVDATPWAYGEITEGAQIYYNPDYADKDIDIYEFSGLAGDIILCDFILPPDELLFDGAIKLVDVDSTEIDFADEWAGGGSEQLKYRLLLDGTYYLVLGKWDNILDGPYKKDPGRGVNTCYYAMSLELIPSPDIAVSPDSLQLGIIASKETASVDMFIENTGVTGCEDLTFNIEVVIPGVETLLDEGFEGTWPPTDWTIIQGPNSPTNDIIQTNDQAHSGIYSARFSSFSSASAYDEYLVTPEVNTSAGDLLSFWYRKYSSGTELFKVGWSSTGTDVSTDFTWGPEISDASTTWQQYVKADLPVGTKYVAIHYYSNYQWYLYVDDVNISRGTPWCTVEPFTGIIGQGAIQTCVVTCDETGLTEPGIYTADIIVHNNALLDGASDVTIPLTFFYQVAAQGLQGTVTFEATGEPIDSVKVSAGNFVTYTDSLGFYSFDEIASGIYDVTFEKDGFATHTAYGIYVSPNWTTLLDVAMMFDGPPPRNLNAIGANQQVVINWLKPETGGGGGGGDEFTEGFESGDIPAGWLAVDNDGDSYNWEVWDAFVHSGTYSAASFSYDNVTYLPLTPDNYLITPQVELGDSSELTFWVGASDAAWYWEHFKVKLSTTGSDPADFTTELMDYTLSAAAWTQLTIDLSAYSGQQVYLAWVHCDVTDVFNLSLDDIELTNAKQLIFAADFESNDDIDKFKRVSVASNSIPFRINDSMTELEIKTRLDEYVPKQDLLSRDFTLLGYNVYEESKGFVAYVDGENTLTYTDDIVAVGTEYTYYARGLYDEGEGAESNHDSATPIILDIEDFENDDGGLVGTGQWQWGEPTSGPGNAHSGVKLWATNLSGTYNASSNYTLDTPEIQVLDSQFMFWHWYDTEASYDGGNVKITTDDGATWTVITPDGGYPGTANSSNPLYPEPIFCGHNQGFWELVVFDVSAYLGLTVKYRWHFGSDGSVQYPGWYIDDVLFGYETAPDYGALEGIVTDGDLVPLEGVAVDADFLDYNTVYTDADGFYSIDPMRVGLYDVTFSKVGYWTITVEDVEILVDATTFLDVILGMPTMDILPTSIDATVPPEQTTTVPMTVTNNGNAPLNWDSDIVYGEDVVVDIAPFTGDIPENTYEPTVELDDGNNVGYSSPHGDVELVLPRGSTAWFKGGEYATYFYGTFDTDTPGNMVEILSPPAWNSYCGDYSTESDDYFYINEPDQFSTYRVDAASGIATLVGSTGLAEQLNGMACDKTDGTMYGCTSSTLYTIDLSTGAATVVGTIGNTGGLMLTLACDGNQDLWGIDLTFDTLWKIDKDTGAGTEIGSVGFNCNYAQSMAWDPATDVLFWAAYGGGLDGHLRVVDRTTGNSTNVGDFEGGREVTVLAFPGGGTPPYITLDPSFGTVDPGAIMPVSCILDGCEEPVGTIINGTIVFSSPQILDPVDVPVTLMVGTPEYGILTGTVTAATGGALIEGAEITASDDADNTYVTYTNSLGVYTIEDIMVGYYTVECTAVGYNYQVVPDVPIVLDQTTTQNFALTAPIMVVDPTSLNVNVPPGSTSTSYVTINNNGDGEMNFDITLYDYGKVLTDYSNCTVGGTVVSQNGVPTGPGNSSGFQADGTKDEVIIHYDGENNDGIGLTAAGGGTFMVAARFTSTELGAYYDTYEIIGTEIYINDDVTSVILKVWEGGSFGDPGSEAYSEDVTSQIIIGWNTIDLISTVPLLSGNEYWVGYEVTHVYQKFPAGCDAGPAVVGKGDWIYLAPGPWEQLHIIAPTLNYNWNIRMVIDLGTPPWIIVDPLSGTIPAFSSMDIAVMFDATELTLGEIKTADIEIVSDPDVGVVTVPVTMHVDYYSAGDEPVIETKLYANFPNPMFNTTTFNFSLKDRSHVTLSIYNVKGQLVETLLNNELEPSADHKVVWDGTANGKKLANGIYFYKLETNSKTFLNKMILMK